MITVNDLIDVPFIMLLSTMCAVLNGNFAPEKAREELLEMSSKIKSKRAQDK